MQTVNTSWGELTEIEYSVKKETILSAFRDLEKKKPVIVKEVKGEDGEYYYNHELKEDICNFYYTQYPSHHYCLKVYGYASRSYLIVNVSEVLIVSE